MSYVLGIDASTQSCTAILLDTEAGRQLAVESVQFGKDLPGYNAPYGYIPGGKDGEVHSDPLMWLDALDLLLERLQQSGVDLGKVQAISGAGQQHGSVYLNRKWFERIAELDPRYDLRDQLAECLARPTAPIWMDTSTGVECAEISAAVGGPAVVCEKSGSHCVERFTGPQIRRFSKLDPARYADTARIHLVSSFFASVLAGKDAGIDRGDGAGMNLMNLDSWDWDADLLAATAPELGKRLPPLVPSATVLGTISPYFSRYGFSADCQIVAFTGDNNSSLVGMGAQEPGKVVISLGTSDTFFAAMPERRTDPNGYGHVFGNPMGGYMTLQCFRNGSLAREKVKEQHGLSWQQFDVEAFTATPVGNDGNVMLPFFEPEITPRVDCHAPVLVGEAAFEAGDNAYAAVRACVEGQFLNMWLHAQWMQLQPKTIYLTGGAAKSPGIAQTVANVFQAQVLRLDVASSVALGGALRAAVAALGASIDNLQARFCAPVPDSTVQPEPAAEGAYAAAAQRFAAALKTLVAR